MKTVLMSMRVTEANNYFEKRNSIAYEYISFFEKLGYCIVLVPNNTRNTSKYFKLNIDFVVLTGGNNVNPSFYNSAEKLDDVYEERDAVEKSLIELSIKKNIPILGICRGFHFINTYFGGSLEHSIKSHVNTNHKLKSNCRIIDNKSTNSFHNQGVRMKNLSKQLQILASSDDDYIEGFIHKKERILGLQWHPERQSKKYDKKLIKIFLKGKL